MRTLVLLAFLILGPVPASAQQTFSTTPAGQANAGAVDAQVVDVEPYPGGVARQELERFTFELATLQAKFSQRIISTDGFIEDESTGEVWLRKAPAGTVENGGGGLFRWSYYGEFPELIVADGRKVWMYDETLDQVTVRDQSSAPTDNPLALLTDISLIDEQFEVRELGNVDGMHLLELRSRTEDSEFERILLGLADGKLDMLAMEDAFGLRTEIRFHEVLRNHELDDGLFSFTPPEGADVIGQIDSGASQGQ